MTRRHRLMPGPNNAVTLRLEKEYVVAATFHHQRNRRAAAQRHVHVHMLSARRYTRRAECASPESAPRRCHARQMVR
jgi:hypothetical protein